MRNYRFALRLLIPAGFVFTVSLLGSVCASTPAHSEGVLNSCHKCVSYQSRITPLTTDLTTSQSLSPLRPMVETVADQIFSNSTTSTTTPTTSPSVSSTPGAPSAPPVSTVASVESTFPNGVTDTVTPLERTEWYRVQNCEEGPGTSEWQTDGGTYAGGLGISRAAWSEYNTYGFPADAAQASPDEQIMVAERIQSDPPDQGSCAAW
jgi:hypothetical protein